MRILLVNSLFPTPKVPRIVGGAEVFARKLALELVSQGDQVEVLRASTTPGETVESEADFDVYSAPMRNLNQPFEQSRLMPVRALWHLIDDWTGAKSTLEKRICAFRPDVIHSHTLSGLSASMWQAARDAKVPIVHTLHDYYLTCPRCSRFSDGAICRHSCKDCLLLTTHRRRMTAAVTAVVGVGRRVLDIHLEAGLFRDAPIKTIVLLAASPPASLPPPRPLPHERAVGENQVVFGFIGRLTDEKGIANLVSAFHEVPANKAKLIIAGRASDAQQAELRARAPDADITFLGFVAPEIFYGQVDIVVVPSIWEEPGSLVVLEARGAGKPVLGSRFGVLPELIQHGVNGWISDTDPARLAMCIHEICQNPLQIACATRNSSALGRSWTFEHLANRYREIFHEAILKSG